jgi:hypothetical protein
MSLCVVNILMAADYCPVFSCGQFNGIFYYYGQLKQPAAPCGSNWYTIYNSSALPLNMDCVNCPNPVQRAQLVQRQSTCAGKDTPYKGKPTKKLRLKSVAPTSTSVGSDYKLTVDEKKYIAIKSDNMVFVIAKKKQRYFRILELRFRMKGMDDDVLRIGHELGPDGQTTEIEYKIEDPDPEETDDDPKFHHIIADPDDAREFYVISNTEMVK